MERENIVGAILVMIFLGFISFAMTLGQIALAHALDDESSGISSTVTERVDQNSF